MMSVIKDDRNDAPTHRSPWRFILLVGVTNLFADMTYEGARGVTGDFLGKLGASGAIVGFVAGGGELAGYAVRSVSGIIADQTGRHWIDVWAGYIINMLCVPALALAGTWPVAAGLMIGERLGRGIRRPENRFVVPDHRDGRRGDRHADRKHREADDEAEEPAQKKNEDERGDDDNGNNDFGRRLHDVKIPGRIPTGL
jgi:hypothetical protein